MENNAALIAAAESVPNIQVLDSTPEGMTKFSDPFYGYEAIKLTAMLQGLRPRTQFVVAPDENGAITIYRRGKTQLPMSGKKK